MEPDAERSTRLPLRSAGPRHRRGEARHPHPRRRGAPEKACASRGEGAVMSEELIARLVQDLRKSGFYSEMRAIHACVAAKWECHGSFTYFDKDARATRECDFEAVKQWFELGEDGASIQLIARLLGQVKKSESPWIVF